MRDKSIFHSSIFYFVLIGLVYFCFNLHFTKNNIFLLYDSKRFYVAGTVVLSCAWVIVSKNIRYNIIMILRSLPMSIKLMLIVFALSVLISTFSSNKMVYSLYHLLYFFGLFLLCCILYQAAYNQVSKIYIFYVLLSFLLFISIGLAFWLSIYFGLDVNINTILSFSNPRFLNQVQVWIIIPLLYLTVLALKRQKGNRIVSVALMLSVSVIIATDARGISIALIATVILWSFIDKTWRWQILLVSSKLVIAGFLLKIIFLSPLPSIIFSDGTFDVISVRTHSSGRFQFWLDSLQHIKFWGNGSGFFICMSEYNKIPYFGHPHNSILQILIEWGVLAVTSYCLLLASLLYKVFVTKRRIVRVSGLSLLAGFAYSFVSGVLVMPLSQLLAVLSIAVYWNRCTEQSDNRNGKYMGSLSMMLLLFSAITAFTLINRGIERAELYQSGFLQNENYDIQEVTPDFWLGYNCHSR